MMDDAPAQPGEWYPDLYDERKERRWRNVASPDQDEQLSTAIAIARRIEKSGHAGMQRRPHGGHRR
jgi:hypothetical protein